MIMEETKVKYGFGLDEEHCECDKFDSIEELLEYAQASWDEQDGNPFDSDCDYSGLIYVGVMEDLAEEEFAPSLDWIADDMTDRLYCDHLSGDFGDVQIRNRKEAEEAWKEFVRKYFELPCHFSCNWFGIYDLKEHKWYDKFADFDKHVKLEP